MKKDFITVGEFVRHFGLTVITGYESLNERKISEKQVNRPGFELCGFLGGFDDRNRLAFFGNKEIGYIKSVESTKLDQLIKAYEYLTSEETPAIVICRGHECPKELLEIAKKKSFPILSTTLTTSGFLLQTYTFLQEALAPHTAVHASLVEIFSVGVLILGEAGIGKSETTLELIKKGHKIISDDRVDVTEIRGELIGEAPELLAGMMEVRGIGVIDVTRIFGINSTLKRKKISYAVNLVRFDSDEKYDRLGNTVQTYNLLGYNIPLLNLPVSAARSMAEIIEVAVTNLKLKDYGFDSTFEFENRMNELLIRKKR